MFELIVCTKCQKMQMQLFKLKLQLVPIFTLSESHQKAINRPKMVCSLDSFGLYTDRKIESSQNFAALIFIHLISEDRGHSTTLHNKEQNRICILYPIGHVVMF